VDIIEFVFFFGVDLPHVHNRGLFPAMARILGVAGTRSENGTVHAEVISGPF